ncbi:hypothetical protein [Lacrimispora sp.]|uniref:hypothetical protein n=1 Tax=Lacrimispora sp. TaxID=2719234 RepID=UPI0028A6CBD3|nr:hypothetical protein [Lacrimispora sp.]
MNLMMNEVREILPDNMREAFDSIVEQKVLGASNHIAMVGDMIEAIALRGKEEKRPVSQVIHEILTVSEFFIATRGEASQAVSNAILLMIHNVREYAGMDVESAAEHMIEDKNSYAATAADAVRQCVAYGVKLAEPMQKIFVYDYSSTVEKFLRGLKENGKQYEIYIAESRVIDGGRPFVRACQEAGHKIKFIPEAAMMYYLRDCDGVFMGAETFYPDGTGFNTTGSDIVGLICGYYKVPLYFLTPFIKLDIRPVTGRRKCLVYNDLKDKLTAGWDDDIDKEGIDFVTPELVGVEPGAIHGFITELGVIPSGQMYGISMEYSKNLRGEL